MRRSVFLVFLFIIPLLTMCGNAAENKREGEREDKELIERQALLSRLRAKADTAKTYSEKKGMNTNYCILIDFSIHSGKNRFFVWDFKKDTVKYGGLCCHGYGQQSTQKMPVFSNVEGSYCSSLGKYRVGARAYSKWGINVHYKMHGLEKTNNNAFKRWIVLHSHTPMPSKEIYPHHLPLGWSQGCPVINDELMRKLDALFKGETKPMLLWIYT